MARETESSIGTVFLIVAAILFFMGLPRYNDPERYFSPPGEVNASGVMLFGSSPFSDVALRAGQRVTIMRDVDAPSRACLSWQTQYGRSSANASLRIMKTTWSAKPVERPWVTLTAEHPCFIYNNRYELTFTNLTKDQVIRFGFVRRGSFYGGDTLDICKACYAVPSFDEVANINTIKAQAVLYLVGGSAAGGMALLFFIGASTVLGVLYNIGRAVLPTSRAKRVKQEVRRAAAGQDFRAEATYGFDKQPSSSFRRKQDADDMSDIAAELAKKTARLEEAARKKEAAATARVKEKERLTKEYEESVQRLKAAQERLDREEGGR